MNLLEKLTEPIFLSLTLWDVILISFFVLAIIVLVICVCVTGKKRKQQHQTKISLTDNTPKPVSLNETNCEVEISYMPAGVNNEMLTNFETSRTTQNSINIQSQTQQKLIEGLTQEQLTIIANHNINVDNFKTKFELITEINKIIFEEKKRELSLRIEKIAEKIQEVSKLIEVAKSNNTQI